jgi:predicted nucleotidyltransferase
MARGEKTAQDVDVAVRLGKEFSRLGFDYFSKLEALEERLQGLLGCEVDLAEEPASRERLQREIDKDRAVAFWETVRRIQDIIDNAIAIERYVGQVAFAEFERDHKTRDAVERCLERISEHAGTTVAQHSRLRQSPTP